MMSKLSYVYVHELCILLKIKRNNSDVLVQHYNVSLNAAKNHSNYILHIILQYNFVACNDAMLSAERTFFSLCSLTSQLLLPKHY